MKNKKAQVSEGMNFLVGTVIVFLMLFLLWLATLFIAGKGDTLVNEKSYAANEQDFQNKKYLYSVSDEIAVTLQALLNTPAAINAPQITFKEALLEWAEDKEMRPFVNPQGELHATDAEPGKRIMTLPQEIISKSIPQFYSDREGKAASCYFFEVNSIKNGNKEKTFYLHNPSINTPSSIDYLSIKNQVQKKSAYAQIKTNNGYVEVYLYYNHGSC